MNILQIDSSVTGAKSVSRPLTRETAARLLANHHDAKVVYRDLIGEPLSHYTAVIRLLGDDNPALTPDQKQELATGKDILAEFLAADVVVVGAPMYNFNIPSQLKAWIDLICVAGVTFKYGANGPEGLCGSKRVIVVSSRGGLYGPGSNNEKSDFQETYLKTVFGFIGITDVTIIRAEGVASGPEKAAEVIAAAQQQIATLA